MRQSFGYDENLSMRLISPLEHVVTSNTLLNRAVGFFISLSTCCCISGPTCSDFHCGQVSHSAIMRPDRSTTVCCRSEFQSSFLVTKGPLHFVPNAHAEFALSRTTPEYALILKFRGERRFPFASIFPQLLDEQSHE